jgi:cytoskeletal protein RodZ
MEFSIDEQPPKPQTSNSSRKLLLIGIAGLALVLAGGFFGYQVLGIGKSDSNNTETFDEASNPPTSSPNPNSSPNTPTTNPEPAPPTTSPTPPTPTPPAVKNATITYTSSGFSPTSVTLSSGGTLTIINSSTNSLDFASDPHPQHTINPQFLEYTITIDPLTRPLL